MMQFSSNFVLIPDIADPDLSDTDDIDAGKSDEDSDCNDCKGISSGLCISPAEKTPYTPPFPLRNKRK